ncbi:DUF1304 domain-containing protein [Rhodobacteraceae bacterium NNCM2]|nr:DUF1304 domain-containing protein [Coraliihabitans acroporae]
MSYFLCVLLMLLHIIFGIAEMFFWNRLGPSLAKNRESNGLDSRNLERAIGWSEFMAFNQGVYNLFLAAGLMFSLGAGMTVHVEFAMFFAACIAVAGLAGLYSGIKTVFIIQTVPGAVLFAALYFGI